MHLVCVSKCKRWRDQRHCLVVPLFPRLSMCEEGASSYSTWLPAAYILGAGLDDSTFRSHHKMPPRTNDRAAFSFQTRHPKLYHLLVFYARRYPDLILLTVLGQFGFLRRSHWQKVMLWRLATGSFLSRYVLLGLSVIYVVKAPRNEIQ